jgi:SAM-dependent methyltransferase
MKPYAESCAQNRQPILDVLRREFAHTTRVLEIGSGTGQHAVYFARALPHLVWQTSDVTENHPGIQEWLADEQLANALPPLTLDVTQADWPPRIFDGVFSANTVHIMHWPAVEKMFAGIGRVLLPGGRFCLYGPFNIDGRHTAPSNARFDLWLKQRDPGMGVRDMGDLDRLAAAAGLTRSGKHAMPADNFILVWERTSR